MKKVFIIFILFILLISCGKKDFVADVEQDYTTIGDPVKGDWLVYSLSSEPATLNPITATDIYEYRVNQFIYESLLERDNETLKLEPLIAHKYEISEDKLQYTFYMRKGIKWHDGVELTAEDVVFTYKKIMDPKVDAPHLRHYYRDIKKAEVIDKYTVRFTYSKPYFRALEFCGGMNIIPKHIFKKGDFNKHPNNYHSIGTGPYIFEKWETGKQIVIKRNPHYWDKEKEPNIDKIVFKLVTDDTVQLQLLKRGDLDFSALTAIQWMRQTRSKKFKQSKRKLKYYTPSYTFIGWNTRRALFKDRDVREALTRLINRRSILKNLKYNLGQITTGPFYIFSDYYVKDVKPFEYDKKKALALLHKAGWKDTDQDGILDKDGIKFKFTFLISTGRIFAEQLATIIKERFKKAGIIVEIKKLEWATFIQHIDDRKFDAVTIGWSMPIETDPYQLWHSSQVIDKGSNLTGFQNKRVDHLIEKARKEFNRKKRAKMFNEIHRIIHEQQPYTFLFCSMNLIAVDRRFQNTKIYNPIGVDPIEWWVPVDIQKYK